MHVKDKRQVDYIEGKRVEDRFIDIFNVEGVNTIKSTRDQDRLEGWDVLIGDTNKYPKLSGKYIDIKGIKGGEYNWIEIVGYNKTARKLGWLLRGRADYIAFERIEGFGNDFIVVEKSKIKKFIYNKIPQLQEFEIKSNQVSIDNNWSKEQYEDFYLNMILMHWGEFQIVSNKDESLYEKVYSRTFDHKPDLITRIMNSDLEELHEYKIIKNCSI